MATQQSIKQRLSLLEIEAIPEGKTHYAWQEMGMTEAKYRKENNILDYGKVILIRWADNSDQVGSYEQEH